MKQAHKITHADRHPKYLCACGWVRWYDDNKEAPGLDQVRVEHDRSVYASPTKAEPRENGGRP